MGILAMLLGYRSWCILDAFGLLLV